MGKDKHYIYIYDRTTKEQKMFDVLIGRSMNGAKYNSMYPCPDGYRFLASSDKTVIWKHIAHVY